MKRLILAVFLLLPLSAWSANFAPQAANSIRIPVLTELVRKGTVITEDIISYRDVPSSRVGANVVLDADNIIGLEARSNVRAGVYLYNANFRVPPYMPKGQEVTISYEKPGITLSLSGKTLEEGEQGEIVKIMSQHNVVLNGKIHNKNTILVR